MAETVQRAHDRDAETMVSRSRFAGLNRNATQMIMGTAGP